MLENVQLCSSFELFQPGRGIGLTSASHCEHLFRRKLQWCLGCKLAELILTARNVQSALQQNVGSLVIVQ